MRRGLMISVLLLAACLGETTGPGNGPPADPGQIYFVRLEADPLGGPHVTKLFRTGAQMFRAEAADLPLVGTPDRPALARDGRYLAWQGAYERIYVADLATGETKAITPAGWEDRHPSFSPDGSRIVMVRRNGSRQEMLVTVNRDGSDLDALIPLGPPLGGWPDWSPDGESVVWVRTVGVNQVEVMRADGSQRHPITPAGDGDALSAYEPIWSPDGTRIAYYRHTDETDEAGPYEVRTLMVIDAAGTVLAELQMERDHGGGRPAWSPDSKRVAFCQRAIPLSPHLKIRVWTLTAGTVETLSGPDTHDCQPTWSRSYRP